MAYKVIDMSKYNIVSNYASLATAVDGVIIRSGYRSYKAGTLTEDPLFKTHIEGCVKNNIPIGIYFFTTAVNTEEAKQEAEFAVNLIKNYKLSFPIFVDTEMSNNNHNGRSDSLNKVVRTSCIVAFCERVKQLGYEAGIYASDSWFVSQLEFDRVKGYNLWVASYSKAPVRVSNYVGWQFSSNQSAPGVNGRVDMSHWYVEIGKKAPEQKVNPYKKPTGLLRKGSKGEGVKWLQYELNKYGYGLKVDGDFGNLTFNAVRQFQSKHNLARDGVVGPKTMGALTSIVSAVAPVYGFGIGGGLDTIEEMPEELQSFDFEPDTVFEIEDWINMYKYPFSFIPFYKVSGECVIVDTAIKFSKVQISSTDGLQHGWIKLEDLKALQIK